MADMAPALTEAATEAHHRLKLAASSSASSPTAARAAKDREAVGRGPLLLSTLSSSPAASLPEVNGASGRAGVRPVAGSRRRPPGVSLLRRSGQLAAADREPGGGGAGVNGGSSREPCGGIPVKERGLSNEGGEGQGRVPVTHPGEVQRSVPCTLQEGPNRDPGQQGEGGRSAVPNSTRHGDPDRVPVGGRRVAPGGERGKTRDMEAPGPRTAEQSGIPGPNPAEERQQGGTTGVKQPGEEHGAPVQRGQQLPGPPVHGYQQQPVAPVQGDQQQLPGPPVHGDQQQPASPVQGDQQQPVAPVQGDLKPETPVLCPARAARMLSRQQELGARARRLCRRLQVVQAKQVERHVRQQLSGLVELLSERGVAELPGSPPHYSELDRLAGSCTARLRAAQGGFDSDATESSSGGESDSEEDEAGEHEAQPGGGGEEQRPALGFNPRTDWRWAVERAAIICRWTWLQAQVSDLEFRIRQQTEIYKQIRCTKGSVVLGDSPQSEDLMTRQSAGPTAAQNLKGIRVPSAATCSSSAVKPSAGEKQCATLPCSPSHVLHNVDKQCSRLTQPVGNVVCQSPSTTPLSESPGSQKPSGQVNGLLNCVRSSLSNGSAEDLGSEEVLGKKRRLDCLAAPPVLADSSCISARVRPLRGHKKRRLVRSSAVSSLSRKPQKPLSMKCSCEPPITCILCGCKTFVKTVHPSTMTLNERIALMDPGYHPILSFPHDTSLNLHFEALLKEDRQFRLTHKLKALKLSQLRKKPLDNVRRDCQNPSASPDFTGSYTHGKSDQEKLYRYRVESWQKNARLISASTADRVRSQLRRTPQASAHHASPFKDERQYRGVPNPNIHVSTPVNQRPSSASHQLSPFTETPPASQHTSAFAALKRKRLENSFDINNIVIPMSMAAAARVEKLQYKEILTPSWCVLDSAEREPLFGMDPQLEDMCDEAYLNRHSAYEELERSRWDSWASAVPQRRGSRSSNKSDGRWTPQPNSNSQGTLHPASPDMGFQSLNDVPLSLSSAAPDSPEPYSTVQCLSLRGRTRVLSWSEDTRSSTPEVPDEEQQAVLPWEPRTFPLSDRDHRSLQDLPVTPSRSRNKYPSDVMWHPTSKPGTRTESIDFGMSTENLTPTSKEPPLPNSISVVRFHAHSGEKIASLEYFPARPVNKR
ncbi:KAT8 regulatory NSL complex subunit 1-like [Ascaphus truei]|uniref:KAT8 regulatory NSL complex subunit 1-like n=1 Tax=Ascaphus truei TaxID=8439 RepID=UPI003F59C14D